MKKCVERVEYLCMIISKTKTKRQCVSDISKPSFKYAVTWTLMELVRLA